MAFYTQIVTGVTVTTSPSLATHRTESSTNLPTWVLTTETSVNMKATPP